MKRSASFDPAARLNELAGSRPRILVAYSGGIDSTVLAHALVAQRRKLGDLRLAHVDHGLQPASGEWAKHCRRQARAWRVPFVSLDAHVDRKRGESPEAAAREARYALLAGAIQPGEVLVTAQHQEDQVETLILQLFRGAGVGGLAAMPPIAPFGPGRIARPLLDVSRARISEYAQAHELRWIDDPSNELTRFGRNFLRHRVLPAIRERWPGVDASIARSARHMADANELLRGVAQRDLQHLADGDGLNVAALRALSPARRRNALRAFITRAGAEVPSSARLMEITGSLLFARADAQPEVSWQGCTVRRRAGRLELKVNSESGVERRFENCQKSWDWKVHREFIVNGDGDALTLVDDPAGTIDLDRLPPQIDVRPRGGGEKIRPGARARTQSLKKLLQAARVSVDERARMPLLFAGSRLIAAGDRWTDASIAADGKSRRRGRLRWICHRSFEHGRLS